MAPMNVKSYLSNIKKATIDLTSDLNMRPSSMKIAKDIGS
jgi:hypothetical protein